MNENEAQEWHAIPNKRENYKAGREVSIRAWEPGDGMNCRWAGFNKVHICEAPVAVIREDLGSKMQYDRRAGTAESRPVFRLSVTCSRHAAEAIRTFSGSQSDKCNTTSITTEADKAARESVLAAHWTEYQEALAAQITKRRDNALDSLPTSLRKFFADEAAA
jgi:hypothetical protein